MTKWRVERVIDRVGSKESDVITAVSRKEVET